MALEKMGSETSGKPHLSTPGPYSTFALLVLLGFPLGVNTISATVAQALLCV